MSRLSQVPIVEAWNRLGGGELHNGRGRAFWRGGDGWNVSLDAEQGRWFDHVSGVGGGVLDLVETALHCDRRCALARLEAEGFIEPRHLTPEGRRDYARRRGAANLAASEIEHWRTALAEELNARKVAAAEKQDFAALQRAARLCNTLENGSPGDVIREFIRHRQTDAPAVARLIAVGEARDLEAQWITAQAVPILAEAAKREDEDVAALR